MNASFASLCFLSYNRPNFIFEAIQDAVAKAQYPCEVIVHDDGSTEPGLLIGLLDSLAGHQISRLILNPPGHNEGVGTAVNRMFKIASGDPLIKLDQDLLFEPGWLARMVGVLRQDPVIGMLGGFKYTHEPVPWERMQINVPTKGGYHYTRQLCGSGFAIPRDTWEVLGPLEEHSDAFAEDMEYMQRIRANDHELALFDIDVMHNRGFGIGPSTVVEAGMNVHEIHHGPFTFGDDTPRQPDMGTYTYEVTEVQVPALAELAADTHTFDVPMLRRQFDVGVVITTCAGREQNVQRTIDHLMRVRDYQHPRVPMGPIVVVYDGCPAMGFHTPVPIHGVEIPKHGPGQEQPRNVGFRKVRELAGECNYVWFLDSDLIFQPDILGHFYEGLCAAPPDRILIGPYDWLQPHVIEIVEDPNDQRRVIIPDYRWASFERHDPSEVLVNDLGAALACFGGNLIWPVDQFERVGGFHPELHHGRCEDGELGLRAAAAGVPMSFVRHARGWHVWHPVNAQRAITANQRDVPLINAWHPWVQEKGLVLAEKDGVRFDFRCPQCGDQVNSLEYWPHTQQHEKGDET